MNDCKLNSYCPACDNPQGKACYTKMPVEKVGYDWTPVVIVSAFFITILAYAGLALYGQHLEQIGAYDELHEPIPSWVLWLLSLPTIFVTIWMFVKSTRNKV